MLKCCALKIVSGLVLLVALSVVQSSVAADLPLHLALEEGSGNIANDSSGMSNVGILVGSPVYTQDTADGSSFSLQFDRVNDRIDLGSLDATGSQLTLAAWIKADTFPGRSKDPHIISKSAGNALSDSIFVLGTVAAGSGVRLRVRLRAGGETVTLRADPGNDLLADQWYHTAATYDGETLRLFLNGVEIGSRGLSGAIEQDAGVSVSVGSEPGGGRYFHGLIDDVRILDRALSVTEIQAIVEGIPPSDPPTGIPDNYVALEDNPLVIGKIDGVLANDTDPENDSLTSLLVEDAVNGVVVLESDGSFIYVPAENFFGTDSFTYRAADGGGFSNDVLVTLNVEGVNDSPMVVVDSYTVVIDGVLAGNVLDNDVDVDGDDLTAEAVQETLDGELSLLADGTFTYTPDEGFSGQDSFTYEVMDSSGAVSDEALVTISVDAETTGNTPGSIARYAFEEGGGGVAFDSSGQGNDGAILGNPTFTSATGNGSGYALSFDGAGDSVDLGTLDVDGSEMTLTAWFLANSYPGNASDPRIISKASGSAADSHVFMLSTVAVGSGVRLRARLRIAGRTRTLRADAGSELITGRWYHGAFTYDGSVMRIYLDGQLVGTQALTGVIDQEPAMSVAIGSQPGGGRHFDGSIDDVNILDVALEGNQILALIDDTVNNGRPAALPDVYATSEDQPLVIDQPTGVLTNDSDPEDDALSASLISDALNGSVVLESSGAFVYTPEADFFGDDAFSYRVTDGSTVSESATVSIEVQAVNDRPLAINDSFTTAFESALSGNVLLNDVDVDGDSLIADIITQPVNGEFDFQSNGEFVYTPNPGYSGSDSFSYTASDIGLPSLAATVTLTIEQDLPLGSGSLVQYAFNEGSGATAFDSGGMGNHGALIGDATYDPNTNDGSAYSLRLDGSGDGIDLGNLDVAGSQLTLAAWINAASFPGSSRDPRIVSKATGNATSDHIFMLSTVRAGSGTRLRARLKTDGSTKTLRADPGHDLLTNQWYHVASTYDGSTLRLFVDGEEVASTAVSGVIDQDPAVAVKVGGQPGGGLNFDGLIDDFRIFERALSVTELQAIASGAQGGNAAPIARNDSYTTPLDTQLMVDTNSGLLFNDTDPENATLSFQLVTQVSQGLLTLEPDGRFTYLPDEGFEGLATFDYTVTDGEDESNVATVFIDVGGVVISENPQFQTGSVFFVQETIDTSVDQTHYAGGADLDGDIDIDLIATDYVAGAVYLYQNNNGLGYTKSVLDDALPGAYPAHLADVDSDQDIDVLAGGYLSDTLVLYENDGLGNFNRQVIDDNAQGIHSVVAVDIDQDSLVDLLTTDQDAGDISWYQRTSSGSYIRRTIELNSSKVKRADYADLNSDGHLDIMAASDGVNRIAWYENDGAQNFTRRIIDSNLAAAYFVHPEDINGDGFIDIVAAGKQANDIVIYRNNGNGGFVKQIIDNNARGARSVSTADFDGDGDIDAVGNSLQGDTVSWYENTGLNTYSEHEINTGPDSAPYSVVAVDTNLDAHPDILVASRDDDSVRIYANVRLHEISAAPGATVFLDSTQLLATDVDSSDSEIIYAVEQVPGFGDLFLNGVELSIGDTFSQTEVNQNQVSYTHNGQLTGNDAFELSMTDSVDAERRAATAVFTVLITN